MNKTIYVSESLHENEFKKYLNKSQNSSITHLKLFFQKFLSSKYADIASLEIQNFQQIQNYQIHVEGFSEINEEDETKFGNSIHHLVNLNHLQIAAGDQISSNFIIGVIEGLKKLHKLESFNLYLLNIKQFNDEIYSKILESFKNIQHLKSLRFFIRKTSNWSHSNQLGKEIQNLTQLQRLYLSFPQNNLSSSALKSLSTGISKLQNLESLNINFFENDISFDAIYCFGICLNSLIKLKKLYLKFNKANVGDYGCEGISKGLQNLINLIKLRINFGQKNQISFLGVNHLNNSFKRLVNLTKFCLSINGNEKACSKILGDISDSINKMTKLTILRLQIEIFENSNKKIQNIQKQNDLVNSNTINKHFIQFYKCFEQLELIIQFNIRLYGIYLQQAGAFEYFTQSISKFKQIQKLDIIFYKAEINSKMLESLSEAFKYLFSLQNISLHFEECKNHQQNLFFYFFSNLQNLSKILTLELNLGCIKLSQDEFVQLYKQIYCLQSLKGLFLDIKFDFKAEKYLIKLFVNQLKQLQKLTLLNLYFELLNYDIDYDKNLENIINLIKIKPKRLVIFDYSVV